jgi:hypothetical protein
MILRMLSMNLMEKSSITLVPAKIKALTQEVQEVNHRTQTINLGKDHDQSLKISSVATHR